MEVYEGLGLPPEGATFKVTADYHGAIVATSDYPFASWLQTGKKDKLPAATTLAGTYSTTDAVGHNLWTWTLSAAPAPRCPERHGTSATTLSGDPEPPLSWSGASTSVAPVAGSSSRCPMHSRTSLWASAMAVFVA
jgi:hypothetical protein